MEATSQNLGWVGLQAVRYRDLTTNEIQIPAVCHHLLILHTKPAPIMNYGWEGAKRETSPTVGAISVIPSGNITECCWRGTKDAFHIHLDPELTAQVAATSFELDFTRTAIPPFVALIAPEFRSIMLAVDAELKSGGLGGPIIVESLANVLTVHLIRRIFGLRKAKMRTRGRSLAGNSRPLPTTLWLI